MSLSRRMPLAGAGVLVSVGRIPSAAAAPPPVGYNQPRTNCVLRDTDPGRWAGSGGTLKVTAANMLSFDTTRWPGDTSL